MAEKRMSMRQVAEKESILPYSFKYKIKQAFWGKKCPVCGVEMASFLDPDIKCVSRNRIPSIQHNKPISKGGKHELGNISVICKQCNITLQDKETGELNAKEVEETWQMLNGSK